MKRVAVFRGGTSKSGRDFYKNANTVLAALDQNDVQYRDVAVTQSSDLLNQGRKVSVESALEGVDAVLLVLPLDCVMRDRIEPYLNHSKVPTFGKRTVHAALINHAQQHNFTTQIPAIREVRVTAILNFRGQPEYFFPAVQQDMDKPSLYTVPSWLQCSVKQRIHEKFSAILTELAPKTPLVQAIFLVNRNSVQLKSVVTDSSLLFEPSVRSAVDAVGLTESDFLAHVINMII